MQSTQDTVILVHRYLLRVYDGFVHAGAPALMLFSSSELHPAVLMGTTPSSYIIMGEAEHSAQLSLQAHSDHHRSSYAQ